MEYNDQITNEPQRNEFQLGRKLSDGLSKAIGANVKFRHYPDEYGIKIELLIENNDIRYTQVFNPIFISEIIHNQAYIDLHIDRIKNNILRDFPKLRPKDYFKL